MSLFGALMGDMDDDPFMGGHMRRMNSMMNSFFSDPFGDMLGRSMGADLMPFGGGARDARRGHGHGQVARFGDFGMMPMMPMGFPNIGNIFQSMSNNPNCHSFSSSTVMTMTPGPDGRPQIYQASQSVKQGPGGVRETKKTVADSRTGVKKMAIGHHINERGHIIEREQNVYSGEAEERQDFINLDEEEAESFNREWESKARHFVRNNNAIDNGKHSRRRASREPQLALPSSASGHNDSEEVVVEEVESVDGSDAEAENVSSVIIEEVEDGEPQKKERTPDKRKVVVEEVLSSGEEEESPEPKSKKLRKQNPTSKSKASSRSSK